MVILVVVVVVFTGGPSRGRDLKSLTCRCVCVCVCVRGGFQSVINQVHGDQDHSYVYNTQYSDEYG